MTKSMGLIALIAIATAGVTKASAAHSACTDNWRITGYYTPKEADASGLAKAIRVPGKGTVSYPAAFLKKVQMEGWGLTTEGWYLGWSSGRWHTSKYAEDAKGHELIAGSVASDFSIVPRGSKLTLPKAPPPWNHTTFTAVDVGMKITQKHLDIYTGTGRDAGVETNKITTNNGRVCLIS